MVGAPRRLLLTAVCEETCDNPREMGLLKQIQDLATSSSYSLTDVLRNGLVLASLLRNDDLREWLKHELDGYPTLGSVPSYRVIGASVAGNFGDEIGRRVTGYRFPTETYPPEVRDQVEKVYLTFGVRELERMIEGNDDYLRLSLPANMPLPSPFLDLQAYEVWHQFHRSALEQVLDSVRTRLLELVLDLGERFPEMKKDEESISNADRAAAASVVNLHVSGSQNVIAAGTHFVQSAHLQVKEGDLEMLVRALESEGVPTEDTKELKTAIEADGIPEKKALGPKVAAWVGRMTTKAVEGTIAVAPGLLVELVKKYYSL